MILMTFISSCKIEPYSKFNLKNLYPNTTSIILPVNPKAMINWDSLLTELSQCNKPIIVLEEHHVREQNISELRQNIQKASKLRFHIAIRMPTKFGERPIEDLAQQLINIQDFLPEINGVFLDEVLDNPDMFAYYYQLSGIARELGYDFIIMSIPNSTDPHQFTEIADALVVYQNVGISENIIPDEDLQNKAISIIYLPSWEEVTPFITYLRKGLLGKWVLVTDKYEHWSTDSISLPSFWKELITQLCTKR